jgi:hypothetical protein
MPTLARSCISWDLRRTLICEACLHTAAQSMAPALIVSVPACRMTSLIVGIPPEERPQASSYCDLYPISKPPRLYRILVTLCLHTIISRCRQSLIVFACSALYHIKTRRLKYSASSSSTPCKALVAHICTRLCRMYRAIQTRHY